MSGSAISPASRRTRIVVAAALLSLLLPLIPMPGDSEAGAATGAAEHPYSDPVWYPLRSSELTKWAKKPARGGPYSGLVGCVVTNCAHKTPAGDPGPHGYWAIDWVGDLDDPIHAAGAGIFHIGQERYDCRAAGSTERTGTWVWIDHGGGLVSRYHHLNGITAEEGDYVTPHDVIGKVGSSGDVCGHEVEYLHFEVRKGGVAGSRLPIGQLKACQQGSRVQYPRDIGFSSWDHVPHRDEAGAVPETDSSCIPKDFPTPEKVAWTKGNYGDSRTIVRWADPVTDARFPVTGVAISEEIWRPSQNAWSRPSWVRINDPERRRHVFKNRVNGRQYRYRVQYRNSSGHGAYGPYRKISPGAPPDRPTVRRLVATDKRIGYAWNKPDTNGRDITGFVVAIRRKTSSGWTTWKPTKKKLSEGTYHNWYGLTANRTYGVRVKANSAAGSSAWSATKKITTLR